jgi:hypothetical protein
MHGYRQASDDSRFRAGKPLIFGACRQAQRSAKVNIVGCDIAVTGHLTCGELGACYVAALQPPGSGGLISSARAAGSVSGDMCGAAGRYLQPRPGSPSAMAGHRTTSGTRPRRPRPQALAACRAAAPSDPPVRPVHTVARPGRHTPAPCRQGRPFRGSWRRQRAAFPHLGASIYRRLPGSLSITERNLR